MRSGTPNRELLISQGGNVFSHNLGEIPEKAGDENGPNRRHASTAIGFRSSVSTTAGAPSAATRAITPDMAANIVREYLLPMFESDAKKMLRKKGKAAQNKLVVGAEAAAKDLGLVDKNPKTVYGELKLSEALKLELDDLRAELLETRESMQEATSDKTTALA